MGSVTRNRSLFMIRETALHWSMKRHMMIVVISGSRKRRKRRIRLRSRGRRTKKSRNGLGSGQYMKVRSKISKKARLVASQSKFKSWFLIGRIIMGLGVETSKR